MSDIKEVKDLFNKKFTFNIKSSSLPNVNELFKSERWEIEELMVMKDELNQVKSKLDDKDIIEWKKHTNYTNKAGRVKYKVRMEIGPELLTQAWLKFVEIASTYTIIPNDEEKIYTFHLCEAPGAFISALNHMLVMRNKNLEWQWMANTLNPHYEGNCSSSTIMDDNFIIHTLDNWYFGKGNTGNIMDINYLHDLQKKVDSTMNLVTADGSVDCQDDPSEQEKTVTRLHFCEIVIALHLLARGGNFVIKMFTMFECESVCNLYLLNCLFSEVHVFKPATSKSGNSEVYVICLGYKRPENINLLLEVLRNEIEDKSSNILFFLREIDEIFLDQLISCTKQFKRYQVDTIEENLKYNNERDEFPVKHLNFIKEQCSNEYISKFNLCSIPSSNFIVSKADEELLAKSFNRSNIEMWKLDNIFREGSLNSRREEEKKGWNVRKEIIRDWLSSLPKHDRLTPFSIKRKPFVVCQKSWIKVGRKYKNINNSKFCIPCILNVWNEVINNKKNLNDTWKEYKCNWSLSRLKQQKHLYSGLLEFEVLVNMSINNNSPEINEIVNVLNFERLKIIPFNKSKNHYGRKILFASYSVTELIYDVNEYQINIVEDCIKLLKIIKDDDALILCNQSALTRFSAGIIFLLCCLFHQVLVLNPKKSSSPLSNQIWIFSSCNFKYVDNIRKHLELVVEIHNQEDLYQVLEIVPIHMLCEKSFYEFLLDKNEAFIIQKLHSILNC
ncbi:cap-specific mRNA (nucleoside-2'-O-)-methyltransferase 2-like isoform X1 [Centruroides vittatus]|uniref:cap-specific mRNA (nucleoside-2'-O-)-methyltransferase 2-like isoform X1 n=1 Tax=Centruroides vittatus TaxID=120091 RepID=UPI00350FC2C9